VLAVLDLRHVYDPGPKLVTAYLALRPTAAESRHVEPKQQEAGAAAVAAAAARGGAVGHVPGFPAHTSTNHGFVCRSALRAWLGGGLGAFRPAP
jgi:hypothetical protein